MHVLCDTCSVIMLLRIAPEMLIDPRFECATLQSVYRELRQQPRFKTRYPWLTEYLSKVRGLPQTTVDVGEFRRTLQVVRTLRDSVRSKRDNRRFALSLTDMEVAAAVVAHEFDISTVERDLEEFLEQEFDVKNVHPLELVNDWIEDGLMTWGDAQHRVLGGIGVRP